MTMVIMNNGAAMQALRENDKNSNKLSKDLQKVASGMKINGAGDGAAEYAVSEKMRVMIRSLGQDIENAKKGIDLVKIAEEGMQNIVDQLRDMKAMAIDSANAHNSDADRAILQKEFASRMAGIDNIASTTNYNGKILMDGRYWYKEFDDIDSANGTMQSNGLMTSLNLNRYQSASFNSVWGSPQLTRSRIMFGSPMNALSPIVEGEVTNLVFDGSADKYKENEITGLLPEAVGRNLGIGYGDIEGYKPSVYKYVVRTNNGKYNIYSMNETERPFDYRPNYEMNLQYNRIPPEGTIVADGHVIKENMAYEEKIEPLVIKKEPGSGRYIAEEIVLNRENYVSEYSGNGVTNNIFSGVELNFADVKINGEAAVVPNDFHGQGISITLKANTGNDYDSHITSIIFDATLDKGEGKLLSSTNPSPEIASIPGDSVGNQQREEEAKKSVYRSAYIIGIKGATSVNELGDALISGLKKAQTTWRAYYKVNNPGAFFDADDGAQTLISYDSEHGDGMSVVKYGSTYMLKKPGYSMVISNGIIGMSGTIGKLETPPEPDPPEPDPPEPDPPEPDPPEPDPPEPDPPEPDPPEPDPPEPDPPEPDPPEPDPPEPDPPEPDPPEPDPPKTDDNEQGYKGRRFEGNPLIIHYGPKQNQHLRVYINDMHTKAMGLKDVVIDPLEKAREAMGKLDGALDYALNEITRMGAYQKKLQYTIDNNTTAEENVTSAESVIRDADMAKSMMDYVKDSILSQTSQAMLAQANQNSGAVLRLLQ